MGKHPLPCGLWVDEHSSRFYICQGYGSAIFRSHFDYFFESWLHISLNHRQAYYITYIFDNSSDYDIPGIFVFHQSTSIALHILEVFLNLIHMY